MSDLDPPGGQESAAGGVTTASAGGASGPRHRRSGGWSSNGRFTVVVTLGFLVLFGAIALYRVHEIGKPITFDSGNYEYYSGFGLLHGFGSAIALPGQLENYLDAQLNVIYYLMISHLSPRWFVSTLAVLQSLPVSLLAVFVYFVGRSVTSSKVGPVFAGLVAGAAAFVAPLHIAETGQTSSDVLLGTLLFAGAALLYQIVMANGGGRAFYVKAAIAGVLLGLAGELKATEAAFSTSIFIGFCVALLLARRRSGWPFRRCLMLGVAVAVPAAVVGLALYLPEAILLWDRYRDPFFPFLNGFFKAPYLQHGSFDPGYAAHTAGSLWRHFTRLLVGGDRGKNTNGLYLAPLRSTALFFAIAIVTVMLVVDLVKRDKPEAVFLEISFLAGFLLWATLFGFYRYLAPLEMAAGAVVIMLVFIHHLHRPVVLLVIAVALALAVPSSIYAGIGARESFGTSYFGVSAGEFHSLSGDGVVFAGDAPLAFLVPDLPANIELVHTSGGSLNEVMSAAWWTHVKAVVQQNSRSRWVVFFGGTNKRLRGELRLIGFPGGYGSCHNIATAEDSIRPIQECQVALPPGLTG
ncbi:MAG: hypothetical protein ABSE47_07975 [Acidimicrobiales bacterium]